ncbi:hypothetical protein GQX73_g1318 [Xylaria multiplex]|uniref:Leucine carboxyl methyltransferase 1 n=1 Tax=Xylaria multiplex TaxID=323545 RepID=A0A7C8IX09_9PEZI|nr:hypothetical protein GQX73_g1318 [Xylaria multiplex]
MPNPTTDPSLSSPLADGLGMRQMAERTKVTLTGVTETLLIPLLGRAVDAATQSPILADPYAKGVIKKLDYDFGKLPMPPTHAAGVALPAIRESNGGPNVRWIDVDLPEVVTLRRRVLPTSLPGRDYQLTTADITDDAWLGSIPTDRPVLVVMEGLVSYLEPEDATSLLKRLAETLKEGELHFDCMNSTVLSASQKDQKAAVSQTGSTYKWAVDDLQDVEKVHPRLRLLEAIRYLEAPGVEEFPLLSRIGYYMLSWVPSFRDGVRFVRFGISEDLGLDSS